MLHSSDRSHSDQHLDLKPGSPSLQDAVLLSLTKRRIRSCDDLLPALREIARDSAFALDVERTCIWIFNEDRTTLRCVELYERSKDHHSAGLQLNVADYPNYFHRLEVDRAIDASEVHADPRTREFGDGYLSRFGISSMLDVAIWLDATLVGVVCIEHIGKPRNWTAQDRAFTSAIADIVALTLEACERRRNEQELEDRLRLTRLIATLSAKLINLPPEEVTEQVFQALQNIAKLAGVDRAYVVSLRNADEKLIHCWNAEPPPSAAPSASPRNAAANHDPPTIADDTGAEPGSGASDDLSCLPLFAFRELLDQLRQGSVVRIEDVNRYIAERGIALSRPLPPVKSIVCLPLILAAECVGFMGLDTTEQEMNWSDDTVSLLAITADIFVNALERRRTEEQLYAIRLAVDNAADAVLWIGPDGRLEFANESACRHLGYTNAEVRELYVFDIAPDMLSSEWASRWKKLREEQSLTYETTHRTKGGLEVPVEITVNYFEVAGREYHCVSVRNIAQRKRTEAALVASERRFKSSFEHSGIGMALVSSEGVFLQANRALCDFLGWQSHELLGNAYSDAISPDERQTELRLREDLLDGTRDHYQRECRFIRADGKVAWGLSSVSVVRSDEGFPLHFICQVQDISAQRAAVDALDRERAFFRKVIDMNPNLIFSKDRQGRFVLVNQAVADIYGSTVEEIVGKTDADFDQNPDEVEHFRNDDLEVMNSLKSRFITEEQITDAAGRRRWLQTVKIPIVGEDGTAGLVLGVATDITARKEAEEEQRHLMSQVQRAQKWESIGVLAGGVAHDFNNLLMGILGNAGLAASDAPVDSPLQMRIERIVTAGKRAAELTNQLLAYSGRGQYVIGPIDLNKLVREMAELLETIISKKAELVFHFADKLPLVQGDATQFRQIVMNLITNASDAVGERGGSITITTGCLWADRELLSRCYLDDDLEEGDYVYIEVADTGAGMDPDMLPRIFDPFFTTKFTGRGLGLAAVLGIVRSHRGALHVTSRKGQGTRFTIYLRRSEAQDRRQVPGRTAHPSSSSSGLMLVVDDDDAVREVTSEMLRAFGYRVVTAENGLVALEKFREHATELVGVFLDMTMPILDGEETWRRICKIRDDVPLILTSGYSEQETVARFTGTKIAGFVQKPYDPETLKVKLARALETRDSH